MNIVKYDEREGAELVLLTKCFLAFVEKQYKEKKITEQDYESMTRKKILFVKSMEKHMVCN